MCATQRRNAASSLPTVDLAGKTSCRLALSGKRSQTKNDTCTYIDLFALSKQCLDDQDYIYIATPNALDVASVLLCVARVRGVEATREEHVRKARQGKLQRDS